MPPLVEGDDRQVLTGLLRFQRESLVRKVDGLDEWDARRTFVPSGTSLLWLVRHMARAEASWIEEWFAGREPDAAWDVAEADVTVAEAIAVYRDTSARVDAIVAESDLDDRCPDQGDGDRPTVRWVLAHLLQETARHAGHADILREQLDGTIGR